MLEIYLLGTGGTVPLPGRFLTSLLVRYQGTGILIDCGEGTQLAIRSAGAGFKHIAAICLTHFHADHLGGLPGLLLTIGNAGRTEPLLIAGPQYVGQVVECLRVIARQLPYEVRYLEIPADGGPVFSIGGLTVSADPVEHWIPCFAYGFRLLRQGRFLVERARALGIPIGDWTRLQNGEAAIVDGREISPADVMGPPRRGIKLCYTTDLRPSGALPAFARGADLFVCEGMYGDPAMARKAVEHKHCLFSEAASMARDAGVKELWLTHFSPSMTNPQDYLQYATDIFPNTHIDKTSAVLSFPEE